MRIALLAAAISSSCAGTVHFDMPMTAASAVQYNTGAALVAYLGQPDASPDLCNVRGTGPHFEALTPDLRTAFVDGLHYGKIKPAIWRRCANTLLKSMPQDDAASLFDALFAAYHKMLVSSDSDTNPGLVDRVSTIQRLYLDRAPGLDAHATVLTPLLDSLRAALAKNKLGHVATRFAQELLETIDIEHGIWQGKRIDTALLDALAKAGNELTLHRFMERMPSDEMRTEARRRILRVHIALSPFTEVQQAGPALETTILETGHNAVKLADHPVVHASFDEHKAVQRKVVVRQHIWKRTATLLGTPDKRAALSVLPELPLRGALLVELKGISRPVTVCGRDKDLDPSPCIAVSDLSLGNPLTKLDPNGSVTLFDDLKIAAVLPLASEDSFAMTVKIAGQPAATLKWGLHFEQPEDLLFRGPGNGGRGPDLTVHVGAPRADRVMFDVNSGAYDYIAIVETSDLARYHVGSAGGAGANGSDGAPGSDGSSGSTCGNGGDGGPGGNGGDGDDGGDGGDVSVQVTCNTAMCKQLPGELDGVIVSLGGLGGSGGSGGRGGSGGSGGAGQSPTTHTDSDGNTVVDDPGCSAGSSGSSGANGADGSPGRNGHPGLVSF